MVRVGGGDGGKNLHDGQLFHLKEQTAGFVARLAGRVEQQHAARTRAHPDAFDAGHGVEPLGEAHGQLIRKGFVGPQADTARNFMDDAKGHGTLNG